LRKRTLVKAPRRWQSVGWMMPPHLGTLHGVD
jgi:hypothetical protein